MISWSLAVRPVLALWVAVMPLQPCCCRAEAPPIQTQSQLAMSAKTPAETCCPETGHKPVKPEAPPPCHEDDGSPDTNAQQCQLTAACSRDDAFVPVVNVELLATHVVLEPLPIFMAGVQPDTPASPVETDVGAFHGDTLRALSCLLTT